MNHREELSTYIINEIINDDSSRQGNGRLHDNEQLLEAGIIDSFGIIKLITFIEQKYEVKLDNEDLIPENFKNIKSIANLISGKTRNLGMKI